MQSSPLSFKVSSAVKRFRSGPLFFGAILDVSDRFVTFLTGSGKTWEKCAKCELFGWYHGCSAVTYGYTGDMHEADPQCWKEIKE